MVCLIFHTAIIINRKNWRMTIKLHFENLSIFFKKSECTRMLGAPLPLFVFVRFSMTSPSPLLNERTFWMNPNVDYYKSTHHPIPTQDNREHPNNFENKSVNYPFNLVSRYILFLSKLKGRGRPFLMGARKGTALWDYPKEYLLVVIRDEKVSPFVKFETILPLHCFLLDPLQISTAGHGVLW